MPEAVVRHPTVSIVEDGHSTYIKSIPWTLRTPDTPNASDINMRLEMVSPTVPAQNASCRVVTASSNTILENVTGRQKRTPPEWRKGIIAYALLDCAQLKVSPRVVERRGKLGDRRAVPPFPDTAQPVWLRN